MAEVVAARLFDGARPVVAVGVGDDGPVAAVDVIAGAGPRTGPPARAASLSGSVQKVAVEEANGAPCTVLCACDREGHVASSFACPLRPLVRHIRPSSIEGEVPLVLSPRVQTVQEAASAPLLSALGVGRSLFGGPP